MRIFARLTFAAAFLALLPAVALAQTSAVGGTVKDTSGAVLPGVTVEAASPVLIEKVRSAVTDNSGQYKITTLRPAPLRSPSRFPAAS
jgi:protocatechuate 3,4-dioxygenase beta subunit